jgi:hypothetical protein
VRFTLQLKSVIKNLVVEEQIKRREEKEQNVRLDQEGTGFTCCCIWWEAGGGGQDLLVNRLPSREGQRSSCMDGKAGSRM